MLHWTFSERKLTESLGNNRIDARGPNGSGASLVDDWKSISLIFMILSLLFENKMQWLVQRCIEYQT